jgi:Flp pilus assembly protein TadD
MLKRRSICLAVGSLLLASAAWAMDTPSASDAPDLTKIRATITAGDYKTAAADLQALVDKGEQSPDVHNLLGFSLRKSGDRKAAQTYYQKALAADPNHKGTLEYQGELYVEEGDVPKAQQNLDRLVTLCPSGCEEREDLEKAIEAAKKPK